VTASSRERIEVKRESVVSSEPVPGSTTGLAGIGATAVPGGASRVRSDWGVGVHIQQGRPTMRGEGGGAPCWPQRPDLKIIGDF